MKVWRICRARYAASAFSGAGAKLYAARWNPPDVPMVYAATSLALAAVEVFVNLEPLDAPDDLVAIEAELPLLESQCERLEVPVLPRDWKRVNHPVLRRLGADWISSLRSLALIVPSAAVDGDWNVLINPLHPDARKIRAEKPRPFRFDERMFRKK